MRRLVAFALALLVLAPVAQAGAKPKKPLKRFANCGQLVRYANDHADTYTPGGPPDGRQPTVPQPAPPQGQPTSGGPQAAPGSAEGGSQDDGDSVSGTNIQEAGVFEPDTVKTDGKIVYSLSGAGVLNLVDVSGAPVARGSLPLRAANGYGYGHQMLLFSRLKQLLVSWSDGTGTTTLALVDVADPAKPAVVRTLTVNGDLLAERRTHGTVRVVLAVRPRAIVQPDDANVAKPAAWLPRASLRNVPRASSKRKTLVRCKAVRRPRSFSGLESLTVLTLDVDQSGLDPVDADAIMTGGETVYSSAKNLFVATHRYRPRLQERTDGEVPEGETTQIHRFSLDDNRNTTYRGSGQVPGFLLNQFSFSEAGDVLRVASTEVPPWFDEDAASESFVTTLEEKEERLAPLGRLGGLGKGERIYAVRFLGDVGYVVTFRQVDPLYVVDLAKPAAPRLRGELKIPGYSAYLHPIAGDRLIGVGYGPDEDESSWGLQVSEFDVSDLDAPKLEHRVTVPNGSSTVEYDHHAFLWWAPSDLVVLPVTRYEYSTGGPEPQPQPGEPQASAPYQAEGFFGAIGWTVRPSGIAKVGEIDHGDSVVTRSLVIRGTLYTVSDAGLKASALDTFSETGFAAFPQPPSQGGGSGAGSGSVASPGR